MFYAFVFIFHSDVSLRRIETQIASIRPLKLQNKLYELENL